VAYDEELAARIRDALAAETGITERRMFGGVAFIVGGNMAVAASSQGGLMVRVDPGDAPRLLTRRGVRPMEMKGRTMNGWLLVDPAAVRTARQLTDWLAIGHTYARSLPAKTSSRRG